MGHRVPRRFWIAYFLIAIVASVGVKLVADDAADRAADGAAAAVLSQQRKGCERNNQKFSTVSEKLVSLGSDPLPTTICAEAYRKGGARPGMPTLECPRGYGLSGVGLQNCTRQ